MTAERPEGPDECGAVAPEALGWPYGGRVICTEPAEHKGDHVAAVERGAGVDVLETWPREAHEP